MQVFKKDIVYKIEGEKNVISVNFMLTFQGC